MAIIHILSWPVKKKNNADSENLLQYSTLGYLNTITFLSDEYDDGILKYKTYK